MKTKSLIIFLLLFGLSNKIYSNCKISASVKYEKEEGWSKNYTVEVFFSTGFELNRATNTFHYEGFAIYAVIFWDKDQASVIKLENKFMCGSEVSCTCLDNFVQNVQGLDQSEVKWNICLGNYCN